MILWKKKNNLEELVEKNDFRISSLTALKGGINVAKDVGRVIGWLAESAFVGLWPEEPKEKYCNWRKGYKLYEGISLKISKGTATGMSIIPEFGALAYLVYYMAEHSSEKFSALAVGLFLVECGNLFYRLIKLQDNAISLEKQKRYPGHVVLNLPYQVLSSPHHLAKIIYKDL
jgi:hypothetical protein